MCVCVCVHMCVCDDVFRGLLDKGDLARIKEALEGSEAVMKNAFGV